MHKYIPILEFLIFIFLVTNKQLSEATHDEANEVHPSIFSGPNNHKQGAVVKAFRHAWKAYQTYAWGKDELLPLSKSGRNWMNMGLTIVDSLDTAYIMNLTHEYNRGRSWIKHHLRFDQNQRVEVFEVVIRVLGGLMSLYYLTGDRLYLHKAEILGSKLYPCFENPYTSFPCKSMNLKYGYATFGVMNMAQAGTLQLEFTALARATGNQSYEIVVEKLADYFHNLTKFDGLVYNNVDATSSNNYLFIGSLVSVAGGGDSYYEYLLKSWIQTGKSNDKLKDDYLNSVAGVKKHLLMYSQPSKYAFLGSKYAYRNWYVIPDMHHLACFYPGLLALENMVGLDTVDGSDLNLAKEITKTCYVMYNRTETGLSPESTSFNTYEGSTNDFNEQYRNVYLQRPETVESLYLLYLSTNNETYREWAWNIFQSIERYSKVEDGYACVDDVTNSTLIYMRHKDRMESFLLAETFKYLYLIFNEGTPILSLNKWVFNTEAHPLPIYEL